MRISVNAKPGAREARCEKIDGDHFLVAVKEPPVGGRANRAIVEALAEYFKVAPSRIRLVTGFASRKKIFEIP